MDLHNQRAWVKVAVENAPAEVGRRRASGAPSAKGYSLSKYSYNQNQNRHVLSETQRPGEADGSAESGAGYGGPPPSASRYVCTTDG